MTDPVTIDPLTPDRWPDFETLFGPNGACAGCWCMWWRLKRRDFEARAGAANKAAFRAVVEAGPPPGLIAWCDGQPVGWCQVTPRDHLPVLDRSRNLKRVDDVPVWSLSCFFVKAGQRRAGLTERLIAAAIDFARDQGATVLEAYPWDTAEKKSTATIFTGVASTLIRAGFTEAARRVPHRPILRYDLTGG